MAKGDIYYLKDKSGMIVAKFEYTDNYMTGVCHAATSWIDDGNGNYNVPCEWDFVADVYCKWDSCTHWWFRGEDFDPDIDGSDHDSYYHLCGTHCFVNHIRCMCFIWKLGYMYQLEYGNEYIRSCADEWYLDNEELKQLIDFTLKDYTIEKVEKENENG